MATSLNNIAEAYRARGYYAGAEQLHNSALAIREGKLGTDHLVVALSMNNLAEVYKAQLGFVDLR